MDIRPQPWTFVTAFYDLDKYHSDSKQAEPASAYFEYGKYLLELDIPLVMFLSHQTHQKWADQGFFDGEKGSNVVVIEKEFEEFQHFQKHWSKMKENRLRLPPADEKHKLPLILVNVNKSEVMLNAVEKNPFQSDIFCWLDFRYFRAGHPYVDYSLQDLAKQLKYLSSHEHVDKLKTHYHLSLINWVPRREALPLSKFYEGGIGKCTVAGGFHFGGVEATKLFHMQAMQIFGEHVHAGFGHSDEQIMFHVALRNRHLVDFFPSDYFCDPFNALRPQKRIATMHRLLELLKNDRDESELYRLMAAKIFPDTKSIVLKSQHQLFAVPSNALDVYMSTAVKELRDFHRYALTYGIRYTLAAGSAIGYHTIRTYFPWDDGIDVIYHPEDLLKIQTLWNSAIAYSERSPHSDWEVRQVSDLALPDAYAILRRISEPTWFKLMNVQDRKLDDFPDVGGLDLFPHDHRLVCCHPLSFSTEPVMVRFAGTDAMLIDDNEHYRQLCQKYGPAAYWGEYHNYLTPLQRQERKLHAQRLEDRFPLRILHLVLYSKSTLYDRMYELTRQYYELLQAKHKSKFHLETYYYYYDSELEEEKENTIVKLNDRLCLRGTESLIPGCLEKTMSVFQYFQEDLSNFDYVVRSNVTTLIDFPKLAHYLIENPRPNLLSSAFHKWKGETYPSGIAIIMRPDIFKWLLSHDGLVDHTLIDDKALGLAMNKYEKIVKQSIGLKCDNLDQLRADVIFYRNKSQNRETDVQNIKKLTNQFLLELTK